jgi:hypothetical protein
MFSSVTVSLSVIGDACDTCPEDALLQLQLNGSAAQGRQTVGTSQASCKL